MRSKYLKYLVHFKILGIGIPFTFIGLSTETACSTAYELLFHYKFIRLTHWKHISITNQQKQHLNYVVYTPVTVVNMK